MATSNSTPLARRAFGRDHVLQFLDYNPVSGELRWKIHTHGYGGGIHPGDLADALHSSGYIKVTLGKKDYRAHHIAWLIMTGEWPPEDTDVDHIDRNRANNAWSNLRLATRAQNNVNSDGRSDNKSGQAGVSFRKDLGKWHARITFKGRIILLGNYERLEDAIAARRAAEIFAYGAFVPTRGATNT